MDDGKERARKAALGAMGVWFVLGMLFSEVVLQEPDGTWRRWPTGIWLAVMLIFVWESIRGKVMPKE